MRKLLNTLYISNPECFLSLDNENVVLNAGDKEIAQIPLLNLESIVTCGYRGASTRLMVACVEKGINICFLNEFGRYLGSFTGETRGNILLRKEQYRISDSVEESVDFAKHQIFAKLYNSRWVLERATRDYPLRVDVDRLKLASKNIHALSKEVLECDSLERIRVLEGTAAQYYFSEFNRLILHNNEVFFFERRSRRPPLDPLNALLSLTYTMLALDCKGALEAVGLDSYCGFLHQDRAGRESLALDLMEEFRAAVADRFVISLINCKGIGGKDFLKSGSGAVSLTDAGRKKFFNAWQDRKKEVITHPYLEEKIEWGLAPYVQALLLARTIRGDLPEYPPFLWK